VATATRNPELIYKIATRDVAEAARAAGSFTGMPIDLADGYLHFSTAQQLAETLRLWFRGQGDLALLAVRTRDVGETLRWEASRGGQLFPHVYGSFPMSAVVHEATIAVDAEGSCPLPEWVR
jgi:uncharacterized protein (DUF952 family)